MQTDSTPVTRRWLPALSLFLLAIAVQLSLPVTMVGALAAALDPFGHETICSAAGPGGASGGPAQHHGAVCPICQVAATAQATLPAPAAAVAPCFATAQRIDAEPAQAPAPRGPPHLRPPTTGPPVLG